MIDIIKYLLQRGLDPNNPSWYSILKNHHPIGTSLVSHNYEILTLLVTYGNDLSMNVTYRAETRVSLYSRCVKHKNAGKVSRYSKLLDLRHAYMKSRLQLLNDEWYLITDLNTMVMAYM